MKLLKDFPIFFGEITIKSYHILKKCFGFKARIFHVRNLNVKYFNI